MLCLIIRSTGFLIIPTHVLKSELDIAIASVRPSVPTNRPWLQWISKNFIFPSLPQASSLNKFFKFIVFKKHFLNKPRLHIQGTNTVKKRLIP